MSHVSDSDHRRLEATVYPDCVIERHEISDATRGLRRVPVTKVWRTERVLGRGGFGEVQLQAQDNDKALKRALKIIPTRGFRMTMEDCQRELTAMIEFTKPKYKNAAVFVDFIGWFQADETMFLAMEYMPLGDLEQNVQEIENSPSHTGLSLTDEEVKEISRQILEGLKIMHAEGFAHRDLKPQNVFVVQKSPQWWVKLGDFGLSKRRTDGTAYRTQAGTQQYMAPEMFHYVPDLDSETSEYTTAIDLWALGCIIYRVVTGAVPFPSLLSLRNYCRDPKKVPLNMPTSMDEAGVFVRELLTPNPAKRPLASAALESSWLTIKNKPKLTLNGSSMPLGSSNTSQSGDGYNTASHKGLQSFYSMPEANEAVSGPVNNGPASEPLPPLNSLVPDAPDPKPNSKLQTGTDSGLANIEKPKSEATPAVLKLESPTAQATTPTRKKFQADVESTPPSIGPHSSQTNGQVPENHVVGSINAAGSGVQLGESVQSYTRPVSVDKPAAVEDTTVLEPVKDVLAVPKRTIIPTVAKYNYPSTAGAAAKIPIRKPQREAEPHSPLLKTSEATRARDVSPEPEGLKVPLRPKRKSLNTDDPLYHHPGSPTLLDEENDEHDTTTIRPSVDIGNEVTPPKEKKSKPSEAAIPKSILKKPSHEPEPALHASFAENTVKPTVPSVFETKVKHQAATPAAPNVSSELPPGWEFRYSRSGGQLYYFDTVNGVSTWSDPRIALKTTKSELDPAILKRPFDAPAQAPRPSRPRPLDSLELQPSGPRIAVRGRPNLPAGWSAEWHVNSQSWVYINNFNGVTQWTLPTEPANIHEDLHVVSRTSTGQNSTFWMRAMYSFEGTEQGDLSFHKGDLIRIIKGVLDSRPEGTWLVGELNGTRGLIPSNYCQKVDDAAVDTYNLNFSYDQPQSYPPPQQRPTTQYIGPTTQESGPSAPLTEYQPYDRHESRPVIHKTKRSYEPPQPKKGFFSKLVDRMTDGKADGPLAGSQSTAIYGTYTINIVNLAGRSTSVVVYQSFTIKQVKAALMAIDGTEVDTQWLAFAGKELEDSCTLRSYNIGKNATVHLLPRIKGGGSPTPSTYFDNNTFQIFISTPDDRIIPLHVTAQYTIWDVKTKISQTEGIPALRQQLSFPGRSTALLFDYSTMESCNIRQGSSLRLSIAAEPVATSGYYGS